MKNVLMISYVFPPLAGSGVQRTLKFVKYLPLHGWKPIVLTIKPYQWPESDPALSKEIPKEAEVIRCYSLEVRRLRIGFMSILGKFKSTLSAKNSSVQTSLSTKKSFLRSFMRECAGLVQTTLSFLETFFSIPDHCIGWLPFCMMRAAKTMREKEVKIIYSSFPPGTAHLIGYILKKIYRVPWVADFRDPWRIFLADTPTGFHYTVAKWLEYRFLSYADRIVVTTEVLQRDFLTKHLDDRNKNKLITIYNGFDETDFATVKSQSDNEFFHIVYTGHRSYLQKAQMLPFFLALEKLSKRAQVKNRWRFHFVGTSITEEIKNLVTSLGLENMINFTGYLSHQESIKKILHAHVLLLPYSHYKTTYPGKIFEYLRAQKPILALAEEGGALADLIVKAKAGLVVPPNCENLIADALWDLYRGVIEGNGQFRTGNKFILQFERKLLTEKLAAVFDSLK